MKKSKKVEEKLVEVAPQEEKPVVEEKPKKEKESSLFLTYSEMTDKQMDHFLFELSSSIYYQAILRLNRKRDGEILTTLAGNDPFKEPTLMARGQGERIGIYNLENKVEELVKANAEFNKTKEEKAKDEAKVPSYSKW